MLAPMTTWRRNQDAELTARQLSPEQPVRRGGLLAHAAREALAAGEVRAQTLCRAQTSKVVSAATHAGAALRVRPLASRPLAARGSRKAEHRASRGRRLRAARASCIAP